MELILKLSVNGCRQQYCAPGAFGNIFDTCLILADVVQIIVLLVGPDFFNSQGLSGSLFRVVRLVRLTRVLRLLRSHVFKDLLTMLEGMLGGLMTLAWAVLLFVMFVYIAALVFREGFGPKTTSESPEIDGLVKMHFQTVPRSMFTIFRCSFGDCSTTGGTPIFEHMMDDFNILWSFAFCVFLFFMVIGLFNVISAIFVESTLSAATDIATRRKQERLDDEVLWSVNVVEILRALVDLSPEKVSEVYWDDDPRDQSEVLLQLHFSRHDVDAAAKQEEVISALGRLDIDPQDNRYLSDILDPSNRGEISTLELVDGLKRLRGEPRRSDIVTVDLMVRSIQEKVTDIMRWLEQDMERKSECASHKVSVFGESVS